MSATSQGTTGNHQTAGCLPAPRESHPNCGSHRAALIACGGLATARTVTGREYQCPHCLLSPYRGQPGIHSRKFLAHCGTEQAQTDKNSGICLHPVPQIVAQPLTWLPLVTITMGMCLMNGYLIVKEHPFTVIKRKTGERTICPFTCFHTWGLKCNPFI